jgi:hypothetical protein
MPMPDAGSIFRQAESTGPTGLGRPARHLIHGPPRW